MYNFLLRSVICNSNRGFNRKQDFSRPELYARAVSEFNEMNNYKNDSLICANRPDTNYKNARPNCFNLSKCFYPSH